MQWREPFLKTLNDAWDQLRESESGYSLRSYAKFLGLSPGGLSEVLKGRFQLSTDRAVDILKKLPISNERRDWLMALMNAPIARETIQLPEDAQKIFSDWTYFAILHFFDLDVPDRSAERIAYRFGLNVDKVRAVIDDLLQHGLLEKSQSGAIVKTDKHWTFGDGPSSELVRQFHRNNLNYAIDALENIPSQERDHASLVFTSGPEQLETAREEIRKFMIRLTSLMEGYHPRTEVYQLNVNLVPLQSKKNE